MTYKSIFSNTFKGIPIYISMTMLTSVPLQAETIKHNYQLPQPIIVTAAQDMDKNKKKYMMQAAQSYAAFWDTGREIYAKNALATDFIDLNLPDGRKQGPQGPLDASKWFRSVVPDLRCKIEEMIVLQDKVILRLKFTGSFTGTFGEIKGKGQKISFSAVDMYTIDDSEKIKTNWHLEDNQKLMAQLNK
jgi:predicted ester cyclase